MLVRTSLCGHSEPSRRCKNATVTTQVAFFSPKLSFERRKIIESRGLVTNAEGKELRSLDIPTGRDDARVRLSEGKSVCRYRQETMRKKKRDRKVEREFICQAPTA